MYSLKLLASVESEARNRIVPVCDVCGIGSSAENCILL